MGTRPLDVRSIVPDSTAFSVDADPFTLSPAQSRDVVVRFEAAEARSYEGRLEIASDDPDEPAVVVALRAAGVDPPAIEIDPHAFDVVLASGSRETLTLAVTNAGNGPLDLEASIDPASASFASIAVSPSQVAPGGTATVEIDVDASLLYAGSYQRSAERRRSPRPRRNSTSAKRSSAGSASCGST
jgi:hypothetical protein